MLVVVLVIGLVCLGLTMLAALQLVRRERALRELEVAAARHRAEVAERQLLAQSAESPTAAAIAPLVLSAELTRATHLGIAAIPFGILEQIPAAAEPTRAVREIHDEISRGVYQAISGTTRGIAGLLRGGLPGPAQPAAPPAALPIPAPAQPAAVQAAEPAAELEPPRRRPRPVR